MKTNYLEQEYLNKSLFNNEEFLEVNYLPEEILHREQELIMLSKIFIKLIEKPFSISRKVLIQGEVGIGKTAITKIFGKMLLKSAYIRNLKIKYIHVNCRKEKTKFKILHKILTKLGNNLPKRGFSPQELFTSLQEFLESNETYLILTLDELNHIQKSKFDLIYSLTRFNDTNSNKNHFLSLIGIVRDLSLLRNFDRSTISTLQGNILKLKKYTIKQIVDILSDRVEISLKRDVLPEELILYIAELIQQSGDIRKGLNIIRNSVKIAETKNKSQISIEDIQLALNSQISSLDNNSISDLTYHQIILLLAITQSLLETGLDKISFKEIQPYYKIICENYKEEPRKSTQIWKHLQYIKNFNLIKIDTVSKDIRGRKSFCSINNLPVQELHDRLENKLEMK